LLAEEGQWHREYGPSFVCARCGGNGTQTMAKGGREPLKKPKPCEDCGATGRLDEAELSFPCSYCSVIGHCYPFAKLTFDNKPHYTVKRSDWEASGITFTPPEAA
ncbi:MAG: hypothetical protein Q8S13_07435, partial [Dehalococcoidia bacterium]|nr:hypothetical protein [Dehalococcoidia bacterium]